jgi:hypothetical protein
MLMLLVFLSRVMLEEAEVVVLMQLTTLQPVPEVVVPGLISVDG